ncbi:hypothetical protein IJT17_01390 [bacterium]|nr:hypothetical protein [bacterium]
MAVFALLMLVMARPTRLSLDWGISVSILGELWRLWALGYSGEHTRGTEVAAPRLITSGPFSVCRNPLYLGNALNSLGVTVAVCGGWPLPIRLGLLGCCALALALVYGCCVRAEERFLRERFGSAYDDYCRRTPRFFPRRWPTPASREEGFCWGNLGFEKVTLIWWVLCWSYLHCRYIGVL